MQQIARRLGLIWNDIVNFRNLDAYVVALLTFALIVIDTIGEVDISLHLAILTAGVAALLLRSVNRPNQTVIDLDMVLRDRQHFTTFREFIQGGRALWVYGPSAVNIMRESAEIKRQLLDKGGRLRVLVQDPENTASIETLRRQLDPNHDLVHDINGSLFTLRRMVEWGKVEYRLLAFPPGFSMVIVDPEGRDGRLVIEFYGFYNELIDDRMHIEISRRASPYWFEYWTKQYEGMWQSARLPDAAG